MEISKVVWNFIKIICFWCVLQSMLYWPTSFYSLRSIFVILAITIIICNVKALTNYRTNASGLVFITFLIICDCIFIDGVKTTLAVSSSYIFGILLFCFKDNYKINLLESITKWLAIILAGGIIIYIAWLFLPIPHYNILKSPYGYGDFYNYIFFVKPTAFMLVPRFSGPFMEPGHLGMIGVFFLYANKFNFKDKKYLWVILLSIILSLSLAGYVLLLFAYIFNSRISFTKILSFSLIIGWLFLFSTEIWDGGDNPLNTTIFERLEYDEEKGISGNNRNFNYTDEYFSKMCEDKSIIWGIGFDNFKKGLDEGKIGGAGIKVFLMQYGIIGTILVLLYYLIISSYGIDKKYSFGFFALIVICFFQRAYPTWTAWLLPYISSIATSHDINVKLYEYKKRN